MYVEDSKIKDLLLDSGLVSAADIDAAKEHAGKEGVSVGDILVREGKLAEDEFRRMQAYVLGIPFMSLRGLRIDPEVLSLIPEPVARNHNIVAVKKRSERELEVAMLDADDIETIDFIKKKTGMKVYPRLTDKESIKSALLQYQKSLKAEFGDIIQKEASELAMIPDEEGEPISELDLKRIAEDLPVVRIVDTLLNHAISQGASDIHIEPMETQLLVRYRIDGILHDAMVLPKNAAGGITARIKVLSNLKLDEKRLPQDGRFKIDREGEKVSFRVSTLPTYYGEKTVMRLLRESVSGYTLESLGFHGKGLEAMHNATKQKTGMILVTGPTGSGKSTTLYTVLDILNTPDVNISTVEDPVEYQMPRINQTQVRPEIGFTFSSGLRTLLRQDPDVIMVGEIRDGETASLGVNAALTGHLVLSTLHTNSSAGAVPRLIDMGVEPFLLVSTLKVVVAQRLLRQLCPAKEKYFLSKEEVEALSKIVDLDRIVEALREESIAKDAKSIEKIPFYKPKKTPECESGYHGRVGIYEVLPMTATVKELIIKGSPAEEIEKQAKSEGMISMLEDGVFKAAQGVTSIEEVFRVVNE